LHPPSLVAAAVEREAEAVVGEAQEVVVAAQERLPETTPV